MKLQKVLITGGAGYVGAVLVPKLLRKKFHVTVIDWYIYGDVFAAYKNNPDLIQIKGDIRNPTLVSRVLKNIDVVIHLACISNDPSFELDPDLGKSVNYDATVQLIDLSIRLGVKRFIYASSSSVYGLKHEFKVTEDLSRQPLTDYSKYKAMCEDYLSQKQSDDFTTLILRPATVCGYSPRLRLDLTVNLLTIQALVNKKITVFGGIQKRPNIHIQDVTDLYVQTLSFTTSLIAGKIYNAGYQNYTILEIAQMIKGVLHDQTIRIEIEPTADLRSYHVSSEKITAELGFTPSHTVEEAIAELKEHYETGDIPDALTNPRYYNVKTMKAFGKDLLYAQI